MIRKILVLTFAITAFAATSAFAQADLGLKNVGVALGYVSPENLDGTLSFGVFADHGTIAPNWSLESHLDYWGWSENAFGTETTIKDVAIGARTKYHFPTKNPNIRPFAGGGLGIHFLSSEVNIPASGPFPAMTETFSENKLGLDLGGGFATSLSPRAEFLAEAWYGIVSDVSQFSLRAGMQFKIGK
jgi:opacity protein-like surface antigen